MRGHRRWETLKVAVLGTEWGIPIVGTGKGLQKGCSRLVRRKVWKSREEERGKGCEGSS